MHLLAAQPGALTDSDEAVDLAQTPGAVVFLSAADTDLALMTAAQEATLTLHGPKTARLRACAPQI